LNGYSLTPSTRSAVKQRGDCAEIAVWEGAADGHKVTAIVITLVAVGLAKGAVG